ncbi:hypothetical protein VTL71DRAFT_10209 [Oculimacula yallundae]|uniref:Tc toxin complex TcA C-terminal TcB-binding domain-containing protein n=1 Tax=Oculimacula yallundae TaxID=86028 RepID=A0ABR4BQF6_9HELO
MQLIAHIWISKDWRIFPVSLRDIDPLALIKLRITGSTNFSVSKFQYDMDFPVHYMRRTKSVGVTMPATVGPYSGVNAILTLMEHKYRVDARADDYTTNPNTPSFRTDNTSTISVTITSGVQDPGFFELSFCGSEYVPLEGFDYETISDVLMDVQTTSVDGDSMLCAAAKSEVRKVAQAAGEEGKNGCSYRDYDGPSGSRSKLPRSHLVTGQTHKGLP